MNQIINSLLASAALLASGSAIGQYTCADYHRFNGDPSGDKRFSMNGQSKSAMVQVGKETELNIIIYRWQDYRISISHDEKILGEQLAIRLVEKIRVPHDETIEVITQEAVLDEQGNATGTTQEVKTKRKERLFNDEEKVLWDNTEHDMADEVEFSCTATKRIAVEVIAPGNSDAKPKKSGETNDIGCVGILIEHMPTPVLGFEPQ
jgi:hypothetical protein